MTENELKQAHAHCTRNRDTLGRSESAGCFCCLHVYPPAEIKDWVQRDQDETAICPRCGVDAVIGSASGLDLTPEFLQAMEAHWFGILAGPDGDPPCCN